MHGHRRHEHDNGTNQEERTDKETMLIEEIVAVPHENHCGGSPHWHG